MLRPLGYQYGRDVSGAYLEKFAWDVFAQSGFGNGCRSFAGVCDGARAGHNRPSADYR
ncbi:protein of unknown function [Agrobacterium pusense]|uniref:Uncharacterized protein n=1 Tax=Agrobacterium pusense TaxID=648995 RepID=U4Q0S4_9HYPH|nr:protein of unknown function [Agrobacterium pusense]